MTCELSKRQQHRWCRKRTQEIENEMVETLNNSPIGIKSPRLVNNQPTSDNDSEKEISSNSDKDIFSDSDCSTTNSSNTESIEIEIIPPRINEQLSSWALKYSIPNVATTELLHLLKHFIPGLPLDARTLMHTPRNSNDIQYCCGGQFNYFGLQNNLREKLILKMNSIYYPCMKEIAEKFSSQGITLITVSINVDGLPITSSSTTAFWPILGIVDQIVDRQPFVIAIYCGKQKPSTANEFLRPFVNECLELERNGIMVDNVKFAFRVSCIIADAPARQFLKCIMSHCSSHGCEKCIQEGTSFNRRMIWEIEKSHLRTNESFDSLEYIDEHQRGHTVLSELSIGLVSNVPLDYLHLLCLGVMKKLIRIWVEKGPKKCKLRACSINSISERLETIAASHMPLEFSRKPRSLNVFKFWKATEYRSFMLYLGPVVMNKILPDDLYDHFVAFHVSIYILASSKSYDANWRRYAQDLIDSFLTFIPELYSKELLIYNFHNLGHLTKDVENFGSLDNFSAFPFESFMQVIKRMVRSPNHAIEQVVKRLGERDMTESKKEKEFKVRKDRFNNEIKSIPFSSRISCSIGLGYKDGCFLTKDDEIVIVRKIKKCKQGGFVLKCDEFEYREDFYQTPLESGKLGIYSVHSFKKMKKLLVPDQLHCKCVLLPNFSQEETFVCIPYCNMESFY